MVLGCSKSSMGTPLAGYPLFSALLYVNAINHDDTANIEIVRFYGNIFFSVNFSNLDPFKNTKK